MQWLRVRGIFLGKIIFPLHNLQPFFSTNPAPASIFSWERQRAEIAAMSAVVAAYVNLPSALNTAAEALAACVRCPKVQEMKLVSAAKTPFVPDAATTGPQQHCVVIFYKASALS